MTLESDDEYTDDAVEAWQPAIDGMDSIDSPTETDQPDQKTGRFAGLLPDDSDTDHDGRVGFLSTYVEWHALILGLAVGASLMASGDLQSIAALIGLGAAGSRAGRLQKTGLPEKYVEQAKQEFPYFVFGLGVAVVGVRLMQLGLLPA